MKGRDMNALTITLGTIGVLLSLVCWYSFIGGALKMVKVVQIGQSAPDRWRPFFPRFKQMVIEFIAHTRMAKFRTVGWAHWLVMVGFLLGAIVWFEAYGQTFNPSSTGRSSATGPSTTWSTRFWVLAPSSASPR